MRYSEHNLPDVLAGMASGFLGSAQVVVAETRGKAIGEDLGDSPEMKAVKKRPHGACDLLQCQR